MLVGSRKVQPTGNSMGVTIPPDVAEAMGIALGDDVLVVFDRDEKRLIINGSDETTNLLEN